MALWLGVVLLGTGIAGLRGRLPGCEPAPYIIRFTEDRPNPLYRRICYTTAWGEVVAFAVLNTAGLAYAVATGSWRLRQFYEYGYFPIAGTVWLLGAFGVLPRVRPSTKNEGHERRYFYGSVWAVAIAQPVLWLLWKVVPASRGGDALKLLRLRRHSRGRRLPLAPRRAAAHAADPARRVGRSTEAMTYGRSTPSPRRPSSTSASCGGTTTSPSSSPRRCGRGRATASSTSAAARGRPR